MKLLLTSLSRICLAVCTLALYTACSELGPIFGPDAPDTIGAQPDGEQNEEIGHETITKPDAVNCGHNDLSIPNPATYNRVTYRVHVYKGGKEVNTYTKQEDKFVQCVPQ